MLQQRFLALLTVLLALCATPRLACACSGMPVCSSREAGAHILAIATSSFDCCGEEACGADMLASTQTDSSLRTEAWSSTLPSTLSHENYQGAHSSMQNEHGTCHMASLATPAAVQGQGVSIEDFFNLKPAAQAAAGYYLQKKCTALVGIFNKAPPYLNAFGGSETYLFKRVLLI